MDTYKKIGLWILAIFMILAFFRPLRNYFTRHLQEEKLIREAEREEEEILGNISGYNFRVAEIQRLLKEKGFDPGKIDGRIGESTRRAIREFQKTFSEKPTRFLDKITWFNLGEPKLVSLEKNEQKEEVKSDSRKKEHLQTEILEFRLRNKDRIKAVQMALKNAGFDPGPIDGKMGERTKKAVMAFQKKKGLSVDGIVGTKTWEELSEFMPQEKGRR